jgi:hypothetical protein
MGTNVTIQGNSLSLQDVFPARLSAHGMMYTQKYFGQTVLRRLFTVVRGTELSTSMDNGPA